MTQRAYRHDLRSPHCGSNWMPKYSTSRGKQTYRCGDCHYRYTPQGNRHYRGKLNRLVRWPKGYSKKEEMLTGSLALLRLHQGWI